MRFRAFAVLLAAGVLACAQQPQPQPPQGPHPAMGDGQRGPGGPDPGRGGPGPGMMRQEGPRPARGPHGGPGMPGIGFGVPGGKFWNNPDMVKRLNITADQQKRMDDVFQQSRLKLIDLTAALQKEEVMMEGLMRGPQLDDAKILPAVDRIAAARAELEKANARMMLGIRKVLTPAQWEKMHTPDANQPRPAGPPPPARQSGNAGPPPREED